MVPWGVISSVLFPHKWKVPPINCLLTITFKHCYSWKSEAELCHALTAAKQTQIFPLRISGLYSSQASTLKITEYFLVYFQPSCSKGDNWLFFPGCHNPYHIHFSAWGQDRLRWRHQSVPPTCHACRKSWSTDSSHKGKLWRALTHPRAWQIQMRFLFFKPSDSLFSHKTFSHCPSTRNRLSNMCKIFFFRCYSFLRSEQKIIFRAAVRQLICSTALSFSFHWIWHS